jgi:hypothetical protein
LGETIELTGFHLDGVSRQVLLANEHLDIDETLPAPGPSSETTLQFVVPVARAADFPAGIYQVTASLIAPGETAPRLTNRVALTLAPQILGLPITVARDGAGAANFALTFRPELRGGQTVSLILGQQEVMPQPFVAPVSTLNFVIPDALVGNHLARLRIDGTDSLIIDHSLTPPVFFNERINIT